MVGRSDMMMTGYHNLPEKTREAEWHDNGGRRFIRTGDIGRFDEDGFLILLDRSKDIIISGGFNIYPSDIEAELVRHEAIAEAAVVGVASERWGETPVAFVALRQGAAIDGAALMDWVNARLGKTQRLSDLGISRACRAAQSAKFSNGNCAIYIVASSAIRRPERGRPKCGLHPRSLYPLVPIGAVSTSNACVLRGRKAIGGRRAENFRSWRTSGRRRRTFG